MFVVVCCQLEVVVVVVAVFCRAAPTSVVGGRIVRYSHMGDNPSAHSPVPESPAPAQGPSAKEAVRDTTSFEAARAEWSKQAVSARGKV